MNERLQKAFKERERKERESRIDALNVGHQEEGAAIFRIGDPWHDFTMEEKYVLWRLHKIDKIKDHNIYWMMSVAFDVEWEPTSYQRNTELNLLAGIDDKREVFGIGGSMYSNPRYTAGDVLMYYAEELSLAVDCSLAFALELFFHNLGLATEGFEITEHYATTIKQAVSDFLWSDLEPRHKTIFDEETYVRGSYYMDVEEAWDTPTWWDQYQEYLGILQPVMAY